MVGTLKKSPIDTLLQKNLKMAESSAEIARRPITNIKPKSQFLLPRTKRFGHKQSTFIKSKDSDNEHEISIIENSIKINGASATNAMAMGKYEDQVRKEKLLDRLRFLGLAPRNKSKKDSPPPSYERKREIPRRACPEIDDRFLRPRVFECDYCPRLFFNKILYRRHTIKHLRIRRCYNCSKPFKCTVSLRRHQANCKKRIF